MRFLILAGLLAVMYAGAAGEEPAKRTAPDSDHDGLPDAQEQALLRQFAPRFLISRNDCSTQPAEFVPSSLKPVVAAENNTIYGQVFPRADILNRLSCTTTICGRGIAGGKAMIWTPSMYLSC